ncbi:MULTISPECIES: DUF5713 family protein [Streptomyces]|uniref:DUF5713 family protein n=1 Tax=Streptomyces ehimensis TaxID=68195 RepID=A0ABV9BR50_9ACTN
MTESEGFWFIARAYGFEDADMEELIVTREWRFEPIFPANGLVTQVVNVRKAVCGLLAASVARPGPITPGLS